MNASQLKKLFDTMTDGGFTHLELKLPDVRIKMVSCPLMRTEQATESAATKAPVTAEAAPPLPQEKTVRVVSERVGVFSPSKLNPIVGVDVKKGESLGIIKGISIQDQVISPAAGKITGIHVKAGELVEFGKLLFTLAPTT